MDDADNAFPQARRSASADAALRAEIRRLEQMTIEERMRLALSLGKESVGIQKAARKEPTVPK